MMYGQGQAPTFDPNNPYSLTASREGVSGAFAPMGSTFGLSSLVSPPQPPGQAPQLIPSQPTFDWAQGGQRVSTDPAGLRYRTALSNAQPDYSPIQSPWQGLARVAQNINGALDEKRIEKQDAEQQSASAQILAALAGDPATVQPNLVAAALGNRDNQVQAFAKDVYDKQHPKAPQPNEFQQYLMASGVQPGTPEWSRQNALRAQASYDPIVNVTLPTGVFAGPRSMLPTADPNAGGSVNPGAPGRPAMPRVGDIMDGYRFRGGDPRSKTNWEPAGGQQ